MPPLRHAMIAWRSAIGRSVCSISALLARGRRAYCSAVAVRLEADGVDARVGAAPAGQLA